MVLVSFPKAALIELTVNATISLGVQTELQQRMPLCTADNSGSGEQCKG